MQLRKPQAFTRIELFTTRKGFTLIELLVVVSIIVILLALLIGGLEKALKAAEKMRCGTNVRGIVQAQSAYALEYDRTFPAPTSGGVNTVATSSTQLRLATNANAANQANGNYYDAVGVGKLIALKRINKELFGCPSLDTSSGTPANVNMPDAISFTTDQGAGNGAGTNLWGVVAQYPQVIHSSYNDRGLSYYRTRSNSTIRTNIAKSTFALTTDLVTTTATNGYNYGRNFHHVTGWNVGYGDGHASFITDPEGPIKTTAPKKGELEFKVIGNNTQYPGPNATYPNSTALAQINGIAASGADEAVYNYFGKR